MYIFLQTLQSSCRQPFRQFTLIASFTSWTPYSCLHYIQQHLLLHTANFRRCITRNKISLLHNPFHSSSSSTFNQTRSTLYTKTAQITPSFLVPIPNHTYHLPVKNKPHRLHTMQQTTRSTQYIHFITSVQFFSRIQSTTRSNHNPFTFYLPSSSKPHVLHRHFFFIQTSNKHLTPISSGIQTHSRQLCKRTYAAATAASPAQYFIPTHKNHTSKSNAPFPK